MAEAKDQCLARQHLGWGAVSTLEVVTQIQMTDRDTAHGEQQKVACLFKKS